MALHVGIVRHNSINTGAELAGMYGPLNNRDVYIFDFSFPRDIMEFLFREANRLGISTSTMHKRVKNGNF